MNIEVLFVKPGGHRKTYQDLSKEFTAIAQYVWAALLANYIRKEGYSTRIYDVNVKGWNNKTAKEVLK